MYTAGAGRISWTAPKRRFARRLAAHLRHGTTSIVPTTTTARHDQTLAMLELCRKFRDEAPASRPALPRVLGAHLYGPYFRLEARGCHSAAPLEHRDWTEAMALAGHSDIISTATIAPELPGMEQICTGVLASAAYGSTWDTRWLRSSKSSRRSIGAFSTSITFIAQ